MVKLPDHGRISRYRRGCRCDACRAANTAKRADERARKRGGGPSANAGRKARRGPVPTAPRVPTGAPPEADAAGLIETAARAALAGHGGGDLVETMRLEVVFKAARIMDGDKPHLFRQAAAVMRETVVDVLGLVEPKDGEADALQGFLESIQAGRAAKVRDAEEPGA